MTTIRMILVATAMCVATDSIYSQSSWFKYSGNPVLTVGPTGSWDVLSVHPSRVLFEDSVYRMWYTGWDGRNLNIGLATSPNGVSWSKHPQNPVLSPGPAGSWESVGPMDAYVLKSATGYTMWYAGVNSTFKYSIGMATSPDGITWTKLDSVNPIIVPADWYMGGANAPTVIEGNFGFSDSHAWRIWFTGQPTAHSGFQIKSASSVDLSSWQIDPSTSFSYGESGYWDDNKVFYPRVLYDGASFEMFYVGERSDGRSQLGRATSTDGVNWVRDSSNPILGKGPSAWDSQDLYAVDVRAEKGLYQMWYGGTTVFGGIAWRGGYAVSPGEMAFDMSCTDGAINSVNDTVSLHISANLMSGLSFFTVIRSGGVPIDTIYLSHEPFNHAWGTWIPRAPGTYSTDLILTMQDTLRFIRERVATLEIGTYNAVEERSLRPLLFILDQNYPNPFNPETEIRFQIADVRGQRSKVREVRLSVFDLLGREVAVLVDGEQQAGTHSVRWNAAGMPSGIYFARLRAGEFVETIKLVLGK